MYISGFHIDSFGIFHEQEALDLPQGLSIFLGRNEAGKSTCLNFFRAMLFGYQRSGRNCFDYQAGARGSAGGSLLLHTEKYGPLRLSRSPGARGGLATLQDMEGAPHTGAGLDLLLGGCTAELYDAIFAFSLSELVALDAKDKKNERIRHALHGAAFGPGLEAPGKVLANLQSMMAHIYTPRARTSRVHTLLGELESVRGERVQLGSEVAAYGENQLKLEEVRAALERATHERLDLERARRITERRQSLWRQWEALRQAQALLNTLPPVQGKFTPDAMERLERLTERLQERDNNFQAACKRKERLLEDLLALAPDQAWLAARSGIEELRDAKDKLRAITGDVPRMEHELARCAAALDDVCASLGHGWEEKKLAAFPLSLSLREECNSVGAVLADAHHKHVKATEEKERLERELLAAGQNPQVDAPPGLSGLPSLSDDGKRDAAAAIPSEELLERLQRHLIQAEEAFTALPAAAQARDAAAHDLTASMRAAGLETAHSGPHSGQEPEEDAGLMSAVASHQARQALAAATARVLRDGPVPTGGELDEKQRVLDALRTAWQHYTHCQAQLRSAKERLSDYVTSKNATPRSRGLLGTPKTLLLAGAGGVVLALAAAAAGWHLGIAALIYLAACVAGAALIPLVAALVGTLNAKRNATTADARQEDDAFTRHLIELTQAAEHALSHAEKQLDQAKEPAMPLFDQLDQTEHSIDLYHSKRSDGLYQADCSDESLAALQTRLNAWRSALSTLQTLNALEQEIRLLNQHEAHCDRLRGRITGCFELAATVPALQALLREHCGPLPESDAGWLDALQRQRAAWLARLHEERLADKGRELRAQEYARLNTRLNRARTDAESSGAHYAEAQEGWNSWLRGYGLPEGLSPATVQTALETIKQGRQLLAERDTLLTRRGEHIHTVSAIATALARLCGPLGHRAPVSGAETWKSVAACAQLCVELCSCIDALWARADKEVRHAALHAQKSADLPEMELTVTEAADLCAATRNELGALLRQGGCANDSAGVEEFRQAFSSWSKQQQAQAEYQRIHAALQAEAHDVPGGFDGLLATFAQTSRHELDAEHSALSDDLALVLEKEKQLAEHKGTLNAAMQSLEKQSFMAELRSREESLLAELREESANWARLALARQLLLNAKSRFEKERLPDVVRHAEKLFTAITGGAYAGISLSLDDESLRAVTRDGQLRMPDSELSRGTREQLYLALRLAYIHDHARQAEALPVIMDDILVNFDATRARLCAAALAEFGRHNQILFFTCHEKTADILHEAACAHGPANRFTIDRGAIEQITRERVT